jgi:hypothetical protein
MAEQFIQPSEDVQFYGSRKKEQVDSVNNPLAYMTVELSQALLKVIQAHNILQGALDRQKASGKWVWAGDLGHFARQLSEFISCDHGEAGLAPYVGKIISVYEKTEKKT